MKRFLSTLLTLSILTGNIQTALAFQSPDILIDFKVDYDWSKIMVSKVRRLWKNENMPDPFKMKYKEAVAMNETAISEFLKPESKMLISDLGKAIGVNILGAKTSVVLHGLDYEIKDFKADLKDAEKSADGLIITSDFSASRLDLSAEKISLSLSIPTINGSQSLIQIDIIKPVITAQEDKLINMFAKVIIQDHPESYRLNFLQSNFDRMSEVLLEHPENVELEYERIVIPPVSLKIGNKSVDFSPEKIEQALRSRHDAIKGLLLAQVAGMLKKGTGDTLIKMLEKIDYPKNYWLGEKSPIRSFIRIADLTTSANSNSIQAVVPGDFCTSQNYSRLSDKCLENKVTQVAQSRLTQQKHVQSVSTLKALRKNDEANLVASISEDYINKLLVATYDAGLWKQVLDEKGITLGSNKAIMRLDEKGEHGTFIMDVVYKPNKLKSFLIGSPEVRFPLVMKIGIEIVLDQGVPVVIVRLNDVDLSEETLMKGKPEDGIISSIHDIPRLKGIIIKSIKEEVTPSIGKKVLELPFPEFTGLGLDKIEMSSDGNGRMNATVRLDDLIRSEQY